MKRCFWVNLKNSQYVDYHDQEWGQIERDDQKLFELLILEGAQAGLSWETVLKKRDHYRKAFYQFDLNKCSRLKEAQLEKLLLNEGLIRNRLKIYSVPLNAKGVLGIQKEFGSFYQYLWGFIGNKQIRNSIKGLKDQPTVSKEAELISKDLKKRGLKFVGPTIIYAFMQASGMVNDHTKDCFLSSDHFKN